MLLAGSDPRQDHQGDAAIETRDRHGGGKEQGGGDQESAVLPKPLMAVVRP
jgi:hypothetical protein